MQIDISIIKDNVMGLGAVLEHAFYNSHPMNQSLRNHYFIFDHLNLKLNPRWFKITHTVKYKIKKLSIENSKMLKCIIINLNSSQFI